MEYIDWLNKTQQFTLTNNKTTNVNTNKKKKIEIHRSHFRVFTTYKTTA